MDEFARRQSPRMNLQAETFGVDVSSATVDSIRTQLERSFLELGFSRRDFSSTTIPKVEATNPAFKLLVRLGGEAGIEALEQSVHAAAFFRDHCEPRHEPLFLDDGGTIVSGVSQGDSNKVLKITVRDASDLNADVKSHVEDCLVLNGVNPDEAREVSETQSTTITYALKRFSEHDL